MTLPLDGLVAVVTGGAGHLGSVMTETMARQGARVAVADADGERATAHADALAGKGLDAIGLTVDVASPESVNQGFDTVIDRFGGVDVLVNNAAPSPLIRQDAPAGDLDLAIWDALQSVVLRGALLCVQATLPSMIKRGGGSIINIASIHGHLGDSDLTAYPVVKAALVGLTRTLATQYGRAGVRCNSVTVGTIPFPAMSAEARQSKVRHQLLPREGRPEDVANMVAFLASPASGFATGADFRADGGVLAHLPSYADGGTFELVRETRDK
ncbi:MAG: SDR family oxidoreductase [Acidimicrobiia bacterium]|nr:SDR family oxidoreductase [Acidimicrobiia bacterium]